MDMRLNSGDTPSQKTGPVAGIGGRGHYVFFEASHKQLGDYAVLVCIYNLNYVN